MTEPDNPYQQRDIERLDKVVEVADRLRWTISGLSSRSREQGVFEVYEADLGNGFIVEAFHSRIGPRYSVTLKGNGFKRTFHARPGGTNPFAYPQAEVIFHAAKAAYDKAAEENAHQIEQLLDKSIDTHRHLY